MDPEPELVIGQADGEEEYLLHAVSGATVLDNETTVVMIAMLGHFELRYFDTEGTHFATVGRWGEGPWEFHLVRDLYRLPGDSVLVIGKAHRFAVFGPAGDRVREGRLSLTPTTRGIWSALIDSEHVAFKKILHPVDSWGLIRFEALYRIHNLTSGVTDTIARLGGSKQLNVSRGEGVSSGYPYPFSPRSYGAAGHGRLWVGQSDIPEIQGFAPDGDLKTILRLERTPREVTREDQRHHEEGVMSRPGPNNSKRWRSDALRRMGYPKAMPFFGHLKVDWLGNLYVQRYAPAWAEGEQHWDVYDQGGRWIATVVIPEGALTGCGPLQLCSDLFEIGDDHFLVRQRDSLDVQHVVRYRLIKEPEQKVGVSPPPQMAQRPRG